MEHHSSAIDAGLADRAKHLDNRSAGFTLLAARMLTRPVVDAHLVVAVSRPRKLHVIEEFILKAAATVKPPPTQTELAQALALDPVFISSTCDELFAMGLLLRANRRLVITPGGQRALEWGTVDQTIDGVSFVVRYELLTERLTVPNERAPSRAPSPGRHSPGGDLWQLLHGTDPPATDHVRDALDRLLSPESLRELLQSKDRWPYGEDGSIERISAIEPGDVQGVPTRCSSGTIGIGSTSSSRSRRNGASVCPNSPSG